MPACGTPPLIRLKLALLRGPRYPSQSTGMSREPRDSRTWAKPWSSCARLDGNSSIAHQLFRETHSGVAVGTIWPAKGARVQRPLWASTSTKNSRYPDTLYVDQLIGPDTVSTLPENTIRAFEDHGTLARTIDVNVADTERVIQAIATAGVDMDDVGQHPRTRAPAPSRSLSTTSSAPSPPSTTP